MKPEKKRVMWELYLLMFLMFCLGMLAMIVYYENFRPQQVTLNYQNNVVGLFTTNKFDFPGQWIHVRIDSSSYSKCITTAQHECGHAFFAKLCETESDVCKQIENYLASKNETG